MHVGDNRQLYKMEETKSQKYHQLPVFIDKENIYHKLPVATNKKNTCQIYLKYLLQAKCLPIKVYLFLWQEFSL